MVLRQQPGIIPAPYLARAQWVQVISPGALTDDDLRGYLHDAYGHIVLKLSKAKRLSLSL